MSENEVEDEDGKIALTEDRKREIIEELLESSLTLIVMAMILTILIMSMIAMCAMQKTTHTETV